MQGREAAFHLVFAATLVGEAAVGGFQLAVHLCGGAGEGVFDVGGFVGDDEGGVTFGAGFEHATFVFRAGLFDVFAGEVNFDSSKVWVESLQEAVDIGSDGVGEFGVHRDIVVAVDLNLHEHLLFQTSVG